MRHLPIDSATARATGGHGWRIADYLLADVFHAVSGKAHPGKPRKGRRRVVDPERHAQRDRILARRLARRRLEVERLTAMEGGGEHG